MSTPKQHCKDATQHMDSRADADRKQELAATMCRQFELRIQLLETRSRGCSVAPSVNSAFIAAAFSQLLMFD